MNQARGWLRVAQAYGLRLHPFRSLPERRFVIFGQGRTGSTLLVDLLNSHPEIFCDREIFNRQFFTGMRIPFPVAYIEGRSKRFYNQCYGFKVKIYQLEGDHGYDNPKRIIEELYRNGWKIIYLNRENLLQHVFSVIKISKTGITHIRGGGEKPSYRSLYIPPEDFLRETRFRLENREKEKALLASMDYLEVSYERGLQTEDQQQRTAERIFDFLRLPPVPVSTQYRKINRRPLQELIDNYDEITEALYRMGVLEKKEKG